MASVIEYRLSLKIDGREWQKDPLVGRIESSVLRTFELTVTSGVAATVYPVPNASTDPVAPTAARLLVLVADHDVSLIKSSLENIGTLAAGEPFFLAVNGLDSANSYKILQSLGYDVKVRGMVVG